jgi:hypothetical protein
LSDYDGLQKLTAIPTREDANLALHSLLDWMQEMPAPLSLVSPMECLEVDQIPEDELWQYELKLAGHYSTAIK